MNKRRNINVSGMKLDKLTLPGLILMGGIALGACQSPTNQVEQTGGGNQGNPTVLGCGNPTACNQKNRESLNRVLAGGSPSDGSRRESMYTYTIKKARLDRGDSSQHSVGSDDNWLTYTTNCGDLPDSCFKDEDRAKAEKAAKELQL